MIAPLYPIHTPPTPPKLHRVSDRRSLNDRTRGDRDAKPERPSDSYTAGEIFRGVLELTIVLSALISPLFCPQLWMLPALAAAGFIVIALAAWDDYAR